MVSFFSRMEKEKEVLRYQADEAKAQMDGLTRDKVQ